PFMAVYAAAKHAVEGYAESVDHELREHGVRMLLIEPAYTSTGFEASSLAPDSPLPIYAAQRVVARDVLATAVRNADDPDVVAKEGDRRGLHRFQAQGPVHRRLDGR